MNLCETICVIEITVIVLIHIAIEIFISTIYVVKGKNVSFVCSIRICRSHISTVCKRGDPLKENDRFDEVFVNGTVPDRVRAADQFREIFLRK